MASVCGVHLPKLTTFTGHAFPKRLKLLQEVCRKVFFKTPNGMTKDEALAFLRHFKPAFGNIVLLKEKPAGTDKLEWPDGLKLEVGVDYFACGNCHLQFDGKDKKALYGDGYVHCPRCGERVAKEDAPAEVGQARE